MSIRVKDAPRQLIPETIETIWPGDSAVDLEQSDLEQWCKHGGSAGLVMTGDEKPDIIRWRPLSDQAFSHVMRAIVKESPNATDEAFRYGCVSITGGGLRFGRPVDVRCLEDETLRELGEIRMELPWFVVLRELEIAQGQEFDADDIPEETLLNVSLVRAIGAHILSATFRSRQRNE